MTTAQDLRETISNEIATLIIGGTSYKQIKKVCPKLTNPVCLTDFTCATVHPKKNSGEMWLKLYMVRPLDSANHIVSTIFLR